MMEAAGNDLRGVNLRPGASDTAEQQDGHDGKYKDPFHNKLPFKCFKFIKPRPMAMV
jgi:hypothetical protein